MHQELDTLLESLASLERVVERNSEAFEYAVGTYIDDPVQPSIVAMVWQGKLAGLDILDPVCQLPPAEAGQRIAGVILNAYAAWWEDYNNRAHTL